MPVLSKAAAARTRHGGLQVGQRWRWACAVDWGGWGGGGSPCSGGRGDEGSHAGKPMHPHRTRTARGQTCLGGKLKS
jgi:hypothetical protein